MNTYIQLVETNDNRRVFMVPIERSATREEVLRYGVLLACRWYGSWEIGGSAKIHDPRYREMLENAPILEELK